MKMTFARLQNRLSRPAVLRCLGAVAIVGGLVMARVSIADSVVVSPLYDSNANLAGFLLPFQVSGLASGSSVSSATVSTDNGADCRMMPDPFRAQTYILKCAASSNVTLKFSIASSGASEEVDYGPIAVQALNGTAIVASPTPGGSGGDTPVDLGAALWKANSCGSCHGNSVPLPAGATAAQITNALSTVSEMSSITGLTTTNISDLSAYLGSL